MNKPKIENVRRDIADLVIEMAEEIVTILSQLEQEEVKQLSTMIKLQGGVKRMLGPRYSSDPLENPFKVVRQKSQDGFDRWSSTSLRNMPAGKRKRKNKIHEDILKRLERGGQVNAQYIAGGIGANAMMVEQALATLVEKGLVVVKTEEPGVHMYSKK